MRTFSNKAKTYAPTKIRAFSLLEVLLSVAVLSAIAAGAMWFMMNAYQGSQEQKLSSDVAALNRAVSLHLMMGGKFEANTGEAVLAELKKRAAKDHANQIAGGLRSTLLDYRLKGVPASNEDNLRAAWDGDLGRFRITNTGPGFSRFEIDPAAPVSSAEAEENNRGSSFTLAKNDSWVWDTTDSKNERTGPQGVIQVSRPPSNQIAGGIQHSGKLLEPVLSKSGYYDYQILSADPLVALSDPNPVGTSKLYYRLDDGPWTAYTEPFPLPLAFRSRIRTYAASLDSELWEDSLFQESTVDTAYFSGHNNPTLLNPAGDQRMRVSIKERGQHFEWGTAPDGEPNWIKFRGSSFYRVSPGVEFKLGTLTYFNGSTIVGSNASRIEVEMNLNFNEPQGTEKLLFTFALENTTNLPTQTADQNADYVRIGTMTSNFSTTINGRKYALKLTFGAHGANGFTTMTTFHTHEGKSMTGDVFGTLIEVP